MQAALLTRMADNKKDVAAAQDVKPGKVPAARPLAATPR